MEAVTGFGNMQLNWADVITEVTQNYSNGINHVILHGSPYNKTWNGFTSDWPGWQAFGNNFAGTYSYRQIYWPDVTTISHYMARSQSILRNGKPQIDLIFVGQGEGNRYQGLLDKGYSYHVASEALLSMENLFVDNARLMPDRAAYKALIVDTNQIHNEAEHLAPDGKSLGPEGVAKTLAFIEANAKKGVALHQSSLESIISLAKNGLPIVFINFDGAKIDLPENERVKLKNTLFSLDNVVNIDTASELLPVLSHLSVSPEAQYEEEQLESTLYVDAETSSRYYYLYNNTHPTNKGMLKVGQSKKYHTGEATTASIKLTGKGLPYFLDLWTGNITPITDFTKAEENVALDVTLFGGESVVVALLTGGDIPSVEQTGDLANAIKGDWRFKQRSEIFDNKTPLSDAQWTLTLHSYGPAEGSENSQSAFVEGYPLVQPLLKDPSKHKVTRIDLGKVELGRWADISLTAEQQQLLGVNAMSEVSGIGVYSTTMTLDEVKPDSLLMFSSLQDQITEVKVNGVSFSDINVIAGVVDITSALQQGDNSIEIKLVSGLFNRSLASGASVFTATPRQINGKSPIDYGLTEVTLVVP